MMTALYTYNPLWYTYMNKLNKYHTLYLVIYLHVLQFVKGNKANIYKHTSTPKIDGKWWIDLERNAHIDWKHN